MYIFIHCQSNGWYTSEVFELWINEVFLPYQNNIGEKCLLVFDQASSRISLESLIKKIFHKSYYFQTISSTFPLHFHIFPHHFHKFKFLNTILYFHIISTNLNFEYNFVFQHLFPQFPHVEFVKMMFNILISIWK